MAVTERHRPSTDHHFVRWAWTAMAMIPVGLVLATSLSFLGGENGENPNVVAGTGLTLIALTPSAGSVVLALMAGRAGERSSGAVLVVSVILAAITIVLLGLPLFVVSRAALPVAVTVYVCGIAVVLARASSPPRV